MHHTDGEFMGKNQTRLYFQGWLPEASPKAEVLLVHGLAEHSGRYLNLARQIVPEGYAVYGFDLRGHGKSRGLRGYVGRFADYLYDLKVFVDKLRREHNATRLFLLGHSMGATITLAYLPDHQNEFQGLILSAPLVRPSVNRSAPIILLSRTLSLVLPKTGTFRIDAEAISRDKRVVDAYINDPLVYRGRIKARLGVEMLKFMQRAPGEASQISLPALIVHGTADGLADPAGSEIIYEHLGSKDKTIKLYPDFYHEVFNDLGQEQVFSELETWLARHS
ncbi:MAG: alpha/beta hydrolase [Chloroflexota bacterium]